MSTDDTAWTPPSGVRLAWDEIVANEAPKGGSDQRLVLPPSELEVVVLDIKDYPPRRHSLYPAERLVQ